MGVPGLFGWVSRKFKKAIEKPPWNPDYREQSNTPKQRSTHHSSQTLKNQSRYADDEATDVGNQTDQGETKDEISNFDERPSFEFDNLYLDLNGTIHPSVRRCVVDGHLDFDAFFIKFCDEIRETVRRVKPLQVLFLAVDGVAPRAKMAQQRKRRFTKGQESREDTAVSLRLIDELRARGLCTPSPESVKTAFDTNVISPGTAFMIKVAAQMHIWAKQMIAENADGIWGRLAVVLSDGTVPGEGEHKALKFIRSQRTTPGYDPNTRHCIEGLDADMMLLALATHELHVAVLRPEHTDYKAHEAEIVRLDTIRRYMEIEFSRVASKLSFPFDLERCIDDFILCCSLVGNDFLPHLPSIRIYDGALDLLLELYKEILCTSDGYLTKDGKVNWQSNGMTNLLNRVGALENAIFTYQETEGKRFPRRGPVAWKDRNGQCDIQLIEMLNDNAALGIRFKWSSLNGKERAYLLNSISSKKNGLQYWDDRDDAKSGFLWVFKSKAVTNFLANTTDTTGSNKETKTSGTSTASVTLTEGTNASNIHITGERLYASTTDIHKLLSKVVSKFFANELEVELAAITAIQRIKLAKNDSSTLRLQETGDRIAYYSQFFKDFLPEAKVDINANAEEIAKRVAEEYIRGMCWALEYYLSDCPSWKWLYPFHFAPMAIDMAAATARAGNETIQRLSTFECNTSPSSPITQLLCVLPRSSVHAIPNPKAQALMLDTSSILDSSFVDEVRYDTRGEDRKYKWTAVFPFASPAAVAQAMEERGIEESPHGEEHIYMSKNHPFVQELMNSKTNATTKGETSKSNKKSIVTWIDGDSEVCLTSIQSVALLSGVLKGKISDASVCDFVWVDDLNLLSSFYAKVLPGAKLIPIAAGISQKDVASYRMKRSVPAILGRSGGGGGRSSGGRQNSRTKRRGVCFDFQKGTCTRGDSCIYSHSNDGGGGGGGNRTKRKGVCYDYQKGECNRGDNCIYSHDARSSTSSNGRDRQRGVCYDYQKGECTRGDACRYTHTTDSSKNNSDNSSAPNTDGEGTVTDDETQKRIFAKREKRRKQRARRKEKDRRKMREEKLQRESAASGAGGIARLQVSAGGIADGEASNAVTDDGDAMSSSANK